MQKDKLITFAELIDIFASGSTDNNYKSAADNLLEAFTDWPTQDIEISDMISELKNDVKDKLTFSNLNRFLKTLKPDKDAWKMESITSLLELYDWENNNYVNEEIDLETIVEKITAHFRKKNNS